MILHSATLLLFSNFILFLTSAQAGDDDVSALCQTQKSCGSCQKTHPSCSWCTDPFFSGTYRCDSSSNLQRHGCGEEQIYAVKQTVAAVENRELGTQDERGQPPYDIQMQPQFVDIKSKPGEKATFTLTYLHSQEESAGEVSLMDNNEETSYRVNYQVKCKEDFEETNVCRNVQPQDRLVFQVSIEVLECTDANRQGKYISFGVSGYRAVTWVYFTPLCGCECEILGQQSRQPGYCSDRGNFVCGECVCDRGYVGKQCEADGSFVPPVTGCDKTPEQSDSQCRQSADKEICSGRGTCNCGTCTCNHELVEGQFCECDSSACPRHKGILCNGHGRCDCGICRCDEGWATADCSCNTSPDSCIREGKAAVCNNRGVCECGSCNCEDDYSGPFCETCHGCTEAAPVDQPEETEATEETQSPTEPETEEPEKTESTEATEPSKGDEETTEAAPMEENPTATANNLDPPQPESEPTAAAATDAPAASSAATVTCGLLLLPTLLLQVCSILSR